MFLLMNLSLLLVGIPSSTFYDMKKGEFEGYKQYSEIIKRAKEVVALMESSMVRDGKIPPVLWIFRAKNYLGMKDVQQIEAAVTPNGDVPTNSNDLLQSLPEVPDKKDEIIDAASDENSGK